MSSTLSVAPDVERPLDLVEWWIWIIDRAGPLNCVSIVDISGPLSDEAVRAALDAVQARHPLLRVRLADRAGRLWFTSSDVPAVPVRRVRATADEWLPFAEEELHTRFDLEEGPLLRCTVLDRGDDEATVMLTFHHLIADGMSAFSFTRDVMQAAGLASEGLDPELPAKTTPGGVWDRRPTWARGSRGLWQVIKQTAREKTGLGHMGRPDRFKVDARVPVGQRTVRLLAKHFDFEFSEQLLERAKAENTSLYGMLAAAQMAATAEESQQGPLHKLGLGTAVNVRRRLNPPVGLDDVGNFTMVSFSSHRVDEQGDFWELARNVHRTQGARVRGANPLLLAWDRMLPANLLHRYVAANEKRVRRMVRYLERETIRHSLISVLPGVKSTNFGPLFASGVHGVVSQPLFPWHSLSALCDGRIRWNFQYHEPTLEADHAQRLADRAEAILARAIG